MTQGMSSPVLPPFGLTTPEAEPQPNGNIESGSRPGTSDSNTSKSSLGSLFEKMINSGQEAQLDTLAEDQNLFSMPESFQMTGATSLPTDGVLDPQLFGNDDMDLHWTPSLSQPNAYPDPTFFSTNQALQTPKMPPQPYGMLNIPRDFSWPPVNLPMTGSTSDFDQFGPWANTSAPSFPEDQMIVDPNIPIQSIEKDDNLYQPPQQASQGWGSSDDEDEEYVRGGKRRKTSKTNTKNVQKYKAEAPRKDRSKPWVRQNYSTKGNSRTGKTNNWDDSKYLATTPHPLGVTKWSSMAGGKGSRFEYNQWGELDGISFTARQLEDFLFFHPFNRPDYRGSGKLILWIQKNPGDSARGSKTMHGLNCRVKECPASIYKKRTINTGHYRVAFDEQWETYGEKRHPMHVAGYAHLYCMERFFDFRRICQRLDVRADDREIKGPITGDWTAGLGQKTDEYNAANSFIKFCKQGKNAKTWADYPQHDNDHPFRRKKHAATLTHMLVEAKTANTGNSKMKMMNNRERSATQFFVNMGDLQMQIDCQQERIAKKKGASAALKRMRGRKAVDSDEELSDGDDEEDNDEPRADKEQAELTNIAQANDATQPSPAPIANMIRRATRGNTHASRVQQEPRKTSAERAQDSYAEFSAFISALASNTSPVANPFRISASPAPFTKSERAETPRSLSSATDEAMISPKTVPDALIDPSLADAAVSTANVKSTDQPRKSSDEVSGVHSGAFFALQRK